MKSKSMIRSAMTTNTITSNGICANEIPSKDLTIKIIENNVKNSLIASFGETIGTNADPLVFTGKTDFGDYQTNAALPLSKILKKKPQEIAQSLLNNLDLSGVINKADISGPGFINLHLSKDYIQSQLLSMRDGRLGVPLANNRQKIIIDFSSPNIAKEMHVGHLRSTIIGDSLSRILEFLGHDVLRLNHVGDWGTQFGMLIRYLKENYPESMIGEGNAPPIADLVEFYKAAKACFDKDKDFEEASRQEVVQLQGGNKQSIAAWQSICSISRNEFQQIYDRLGVSILERGESFYNPFLPSIVQELVKEGMAMESEGAQCIFLPGYKNIDGSPMPMIIQKSDGGFLYSTTDLASLKHRIEVECAQRIIYVTDAGQAQHFDMVFQVAKNSTTLLNNPNRPDNKNVELVHVPFGLVLGEDGKKIKSRAGDSVKLRELLDEAVKIAEDEMLSRLENNNNIIGNNNNVNDNDKTETILLTEDMKKVIRILAMGSVKYADLSMNRESNYRFSFKKMLSLNGNTAPYMLYAYVRIQGIKRKAAQNVLSNNDNNNSNDYELQLKKVVESLKPEQLLLDTDAELALAKHLIRVGEVIHEIGDDLFPNK
eukprot:gene5746-7935_t